MAAGGAMEAVVDMVEPWLKVVADVRSLSPTCVISLTSARWLTNTSF